MVSFACPDPRPSVPVGGRPAGTFDYTFRDIETADITIEEIGILAWGCGIITDPKRKLWFADLVDMFNNNKEANVRDAIDEIRVAAGRQPALTPPPTLGIEEITDNYYVLTPASSIVDSAGNLIKKIRTLTILPLTSNQVTALSDRGYDIDRVDKYSSIEMFVGEFSDPIMMNNQRINNEPVTLFAGGGSSNENKGVFDGGEQDVNLDINLDPLDSEKQGGEQIFIDQDGHISTGIIDGGEGTIRNTAQGETGAAGTGSSALLPLGILMLLSGELG